MINHIYYLKNILVNDIDYLYQHSLINFKTDLTQTNNNSENTFTSSIIINPVCTNINYGLISSSTSSFGLSFWFAFKNNANIIDKYYLMGNQSVLNLYLSNSKIYINSNNLDIYSYSLNYLDSFSYNNIILNGNNTSNNILLYLNNQLLTTISESNFKASTQNYGFCYACNISSSFNVYNKINIRNILKINKEFTEIQRNAIYDNKITSIESDYTYSSSLFYNQALKSNIINIHGYNISNSYIEPDSSSLVAEYKFYNGSLYDSINLNKCTITNYIYSNSLDQNNDYNAFRFGSASETHTFDTNLQYLSNSFTISFWAKPETSMKSNVVLATTGTNFYLYNISMFYPNYYNADNNAGMGISISPTCVYVCERADSYMSALLLLTSSSLSNWNHYTVVCHPSNYYYLYLNGVYVTSSLQSIRNNIYCPHTIKKYTSTASFIGNYTNVRFFNMALSASEISRWYIKDISMPNILLPKYPFSSNIDIDNNQLDYIGQANFPIVIQNFTGNTSSFQETSYSINLSEFSHIDFNYTNTTEYLLQKWNKLAYVSNSNYYPEYYNKNSFSKFYKQYFENNNLSNYTWVSNSLHLIDIMNWTNNRLLGQLFFQEHYNISNSKIAISDILEFSVKMDNISDYRKILNFYNGQTKTDLTNIKNNSQSIFTYLDSINNANYVLTSYSITII